MRRCGGLLVLVLTVAGARAADDLDAFRRAEHAFESGKWKEAEPLYRRLAQDANDDRAATCYERLMHIYARVGRLDRAIKNGLRCRELLVRTGASNRLPYIDVRLGEFYCAFRHYREADRHLSRVLQADPSGVALPPLVRLTALQYLARSAEGRGMGDRAAHFWARVEAEALRQLGPHSAGVLTQPERIAITWTLTDCYRSQKGPHPADVLAAALAGHTLPQRIAAACVLADSYRFQKQSNQAIALLTSLLPVHTRLGDRAGRRDTLRRLAAHHLRAGHNARAEDCLKDALRLHDQVAPQDLVLRGDLSAELADAIPAGNRKKDVEYWRGQAVKAWKTALKRNPTAPQAIDAFWKLDQLYQQDHAYATALALAEAQATQWSGSALFDPRLKSEIGALRELLGLRADALAPLSQATDELKLQDPPDLSSLPQAFLNLAEVEQSTDDPDSAVASAQRCIELYDEYSLPADLVVAEAYNVRGVCAALGGKYSDAVQHLSNGDKLCRDLADRLGRPAVALRANILLNLALIYKSQGELRKAIEACVQARELYATVLPDDEQRLAAFDAALASMYATQLRLEDAYRLSQDLLRVCRKFNIRGGPLPVTALHCQALYDLAPPRRNLAAAKTAWEQVRDILIRDRESLLLPRTYNYLALIEQIQGQFSRAEDLYNKARALERKYPNLYPVVRFITLWRQAGVLDRQGRRTEARDLLREAVDVVEKTRMQLWGAGDLRASYFEQFTPGFEQLIELCVRDKNIEEALSTLTRSRSRALLDQLQLAGVDPRAELKGKGPEEARLLEREDALRRKINSLRYKAQALTLESADEPRARQLLKEMDEAQAEYAEVWDQIVNRSSLYHKLHPDLSTRTLLTTLRGGALHKGTLLLAYYLGRSRSYLLVLGDSRTRPEAFPLTVPAAVAQRAEMPQRLTAEEDLADRLRRGLDIVPVGPPPEPVQAPPAVGDGRVVPLTQGVARALITQHCEWLAAGPRARRRDLVLVENKEGRQVPLSLGEVLSASLLPAAARRYIRECGAGHLIVVPDGPLHKLPLEALLMESGKSPRYVLDELPPISYVPSAAVLKLLIEQPLPDQPLSPLNLSLLTLCDPQYRAWKPVSRKVPADAQELLKLTARLPLLPGSRKESERIRAFFDPHLVQVLQGPDATARNVKAHVRSKRFIHLAAHAFAEERLGNMFGAVALAPPAGPYSEDESAFLTLHEIYQLQLHDCELAVLSACVTNIGPQQPLEAGMTLASGFLAGGARRVVASQWGVDDESTALLMETFFKEVTDAVRHGRAPDYALALHRARQAVRTTGLQYSRKHDDPRSDWADPSYWAPFELLGAAH